MRSGHCRSLLLIALVVAGSYVLGCGDDDDGGNQNNNAVGDDGSAASCGNGVSEGVEECDDGEDNSDTRADACRTTCELPACGDGVTDDGEDCDDGPQNSDIVPDACRSDCVAPGCGDGVVDVASGETCDDGNDVEDDGCSPDCLVEHCGNGVVDPGEICDDGNIQSGDGCSASCASDESCGNGMVDLLSTPPEQCDDGNLQGGDGCSPACQIEVCGNAILDPGEACEDGNLVGGDGCSPDCQSDESCGNGYPDFWAGEQCDDANHRSHDGCSSGCTGEFPQWTQYAAPLGTLSEHCLVYDIARSRLVVFGGTGSGGVFGEGTFEHDGVRWHQVTTPHTPPGRREAMAAYDAHRGVMVVFGGENANYLNDTWEYDGTDWTQVTTANAPSPRRSAAMTYDAGRQRVVLFGGNSGSDDLGDTWEYDGTNWQLRSPATSPSSRARLRAVYDSGRQVVVMVGGSSAAGGVDDTWEYNGTTWSLVTTPTSPGRWTEHAMAYDASRGVTVVFSGVHEGTVCGENLCKDVWEYDGTDWTEVTGGTGPVARRSHTMAYDPGLGKIVLLAGSANSGALLDDTWAWDGAQWASLGGPVERSRHAMVYDAARRVLVMFGGTQLLSSAEEAPGTWLFEDGGWRRWSCADSSGCPTPRSGHSMVYDSVREQTVLFGGGYTNASSVYVALDDTWEFDGAVWSEIPTSTRPPARTTFAMAFDPIRGRTVLHGGQLEGNPGGVPFSDTWEYDGLNWVEVTTVTTPPPAYGTMTWDGSNLEIVLAAGLTTSGVTDVWTFDGVDWTRKNPTQGPLVRGWPILVFDPLRGRTVFFGGMAFSGYPDDTWEWDGTHWTQIFTNPPAGRGFAAAAYHAGMSKVAMHGGFGGFDLDDLHFFQYSSQWPEEVCDSGQDVDQDGQTDCADPDCEGQRCAAGMICVGATCVTL